MLANFFRISLASLVAASAILAQPRSAATSPKLVAEALDEYCVTCHNPTARAAGIVIDPKAVTNLPANAEVWEKVIRQLRAQSMPKTSNA